MISNTATASSTPSSRIPFALRPILLAILALAGMGLSIYLTQHYYDLHAGESPLNSFCVLGGKINCNAVAASRFAEVMPGLPVSSFAAGWFLTLLISSLFLWSAAWRKEAQRFILLLTSAGLVTSLSYLVIMIAVLQTYCVFCIGVDSAVLLSFLTALSFRISPLSTSSDSASDDASAKSQWKTFIGIAVASVAITILLLKGLETAPQVDAFTLEQMVEQVMNQPVVAVKSGDEFPSIGPKNAPITVVEFSDFQCPYCRRGAFLLNALMTQYPGKIRVVFRNYPLDSSCNTRLQHAGHPFACEAAKTAICAHRQGQFEPVYETLFDRQEGINSEKIKDIAREKGVAMDQLAGCVAAPETMSAIGQDIEEGGMLGVKATPTFFINGKKMEGPFPMPVWRKILDQMLKS